MSPQFPSIARAKLLAVADRAARVPVEDREARVRERDHLEPGRRARARGAGRRGCAARARGCGARGDARARRRARARRGGRTEWRSGSRRYGANQRLPFSGELPEVAVLDRIDLARCRRPTVAIAAILPPPSAIHAQTASSRSTSRSTEPSSPKRYGTQAPRSATRHDDVLVVEPDERRREARREVREIGRRRAKKNVRSSSAPSRRWERPSFTQRPMFSPAAGLAACRGRASRACRPATRRRRRSRP